MGWSLYDRDLCPERVLPDIAPVALQLPENHIQLLHLFGIIWNVFSNGAPCQVYAKCLAHN